FPRLSKLLNLRAVPKPMSEPGHLGDKKTRTRDLCRDRVAVSGCNFTAPIATLGALGNTREVSYCNPDSLTEFSEICGSPFIGNASCGSIPPPLPLIFLMYGHSNVR